MFSDQISAVNAACLAQLGRAVTYQQGSGAPFTVNGILDKRTEEELHAGGLYIKLFVNLADFTTQPAQADQVTIDSATYKVFEVHIDVGGGAWLWLREE